jgi:hypothetical protein
VASTHSGPTTASTPASTRRSTDISSNTASMMSRLAGPNAFGLLWSKPLSRVIRASVPAVACGTGHLASPGKNSRHYVTRW